MDFLFIRRLAELGGGEHSNALEFAMLGLLWAIVELDWLWTTLVRHWGNLVESGDAIRGKRFLHVKDAAFITLKDQHLSNFTSATLLLF